MNQQSYHSDDLTCTKEAEKRQNKGKQKDTADVKYQNSQKITTCRTSKTDEISKQLKFLKP